MINSIQELVFYQGVIDIERRKLGQFRIKFQEYYDIGFITGKILKFDKNNSDILIEIKKEIKRLSL